MKILKLALLLIIIVIGGFFVIQNMELISIKFINSKLEIPLSVAIILFYILGAVSGGLLFSLLKKLTQDKKDD